MTEEIKIMINFLSNHKDSFATNLHEKGTTDLTMHKINTGDTLPIKQRFYRTGPKQSEIIKTQLQKMLDHNIISPSNSPCSSPVVLAPTKMANGGSVQIFVNLML